MGSHDLRGGSAWRSLCVGHIFHCQRNRRSAWPNVPSNRHSLSVASKHRPAGLGTLCRFEYKMAVALGSALLFYIHLARAILHTPRNLRAKLPLDDVFPVVAGSRWG